MTRSAVRGGNDTGPGMIATDIVGDAHFQTIKLDLGAHGETAPVSGAVPISGGDTASIDAFGRWRVSNPTTLWDSKLLHDNQPLFWDDAQTSGTATTSTYGTAQAEVVLAVGTAAGTRVRQSKRRLVYQPGKSQLVFQTYVLGAAASGITRRVGYFDAANGIYLEQTGAGLSWNIRSSTTGSAAADSVAQADWNLDTLDGNGASGVTISGTAAQISVIDFEWLGVGRVRVGFVVDGAVIYVHQFVHANTIDGVYMSTPNLPVRYEIANDGTGPAATLTCICSTVMSEGGVQRTGINRTVDRGSTPLVTLNDASLYPLIAIRLNSSYLDSTVLVNRIGILCTSTSIYRWALLLNPTVAGTALSFTRVANSAVDAAVGASNATTVTGGTVIASGYDNSGNISSTEITSQVNDISLGSLIDGTSDVIVLAAQRITGTTETFYATLSWEEQT